MQTNLTRLRQSGKLWCLGLLESVQLQRVVVLVALDDTGQLWNKIQQCIVLNGCVFLGSLGWWEWALSPSIRWLLRHTVTPTWGPQATEVLHQCLGLLYQVAWLLPAYVITMLVSCSWYNSIAQLGVETRDRHVARLRAEQQRLQPHDLPQGRATSGSHVTSEPGKQLQPSPNGDGTGFETIAEEVYRVALFAMLYAEVWALGRLPRVGPVLYLLATCWLMAYYSFDYAWTLRGMRLKQRLALFESCAPFFAGFGLIMALTTFLLPFYLGAALSSILFPIFVLVACDSKADIVLQMVPASSASTSSDTPAPMRLPLFKLAAQPTAWLLRQLFKGSHAMSGGSTGGRRVQ
mmetsp:Transcript_21350/g.36360  ORF Transcript_21350/g.36360 Transcript_21350/m.36360 type:complete len:349 (-) Transcript_21350:148-1194(-)